MKNGDIQWVWVGMLEFQRNTLLLDSILTGWHLGKWHDLVEALEVIEAFNKGQWPAAILVSQNVGVWHYHFLRDPVYPRYLLTFRWWFWMILDEITRPICSNSSARESDRLSATGTKSVQQHSKLAGGCEIGPLRIRGVSPKRRGWLILRVKVCRTHSEPINYIELYGGTPNHPF